MKGSSALHIPLAERMRPKNFDGFVGQEALVGKGTLLRKLIETDSLGSCIFWGPPGVGKTTVASLIAEYSDAHFEILSAVESGKKDLQRVVAEARKRQEASNPPSPAGFGGRGKTVLFVDEIHRWNKAQQDALLPYVEKGVITLIGATTENPSFEIIRPLLSRSRVFIIPPLTAEDIVHIIRLALEDKERGLGNVSLTIEPDILALLATLSGGDARVALNALEIAVLAKQKKKGVMTLEKKDITDALQKHTLVFDKKGEEFYNLISALHKSMRGSDANASIYWLARMLEAGADPLYVARRVLRFASEDIGMANGEALIQANAAFDACHKLGMPECSVHLAQAVVYCAKSQKSNVLYTAYKKAAKDAAATSHLGVPLHLRNAPTDFMKDIGYGKGYKYTPDFKEGGEQDYLPQELLGKKYL